MMRTDRSLFALLFFLLLGIVTVGMASMPPELMNYQGVLRGASGAPLDGSYDMIFRFTDSPSGGTLLLTDYHTGPDAVVVSGGLFSVLLGGGTLSPGTELSLQSVFANHAPVYLEIQVGAEALAPRVQIVSTGYALNAGQLGGRPPGEFLDTGSVDQIKQGALTSMTGLVAEPAATTGAVRAVNATTYSNAGVGVLGTALAGDGPTEGVRGQSTSPDGRGVVGGAFSPTGGSIGVYGVSHSTDGTGILGVASATSGGTVGVGGEIFSSLGTAVAGVARATSGDAWGVYGETMSPDGYGVVSIGDSITSGDIYATGTKFFLTEHPARADRAIRFACLEGGEVGVYHRGSGRLTDGQARIEFPDPFPLVAAGSITVQVTPQEEAGTLYVPRGEISAGGFTVREAGDSRTSADFTYLVIAERSGRENVQPVRSISLSDKILTTTRLSPNQKASLRASMLPDFERAVGDEDRAALYTALHRGDFDGSCRLVGGCGAEAQRRVRTSTTDAPTTAAVRRSSSPAVEADRSQVSAAPMSVPAPSLIVQQVASEAVEPGDVVVVDRRGDGALRPGRDAYDRGAIGVAAFVDRPVLPGETVPVAIAGIVSCRVDADYGRIEVGDLLVVSPTPGHVMRLFDPAPGGSVVGKALEPLEAGRGKIRILLTPR